MNIKKFWMKNSPIILCASAALGVIATGVTTAMATIKAKEKVDDEMLIDKREIVLKTIPYYIAPVSIAAGTIFCIFQSNAQNEKKQKALISAYMLLKTTLDEHKAQDPGMFRAIEDEIAVKNMPENDSELPLFYESYGKRYFNISMEDYKDAIYKLNRNMALRGYVSLNEFYAFLGLPGDDELLDILGWDSITLAEGDGAYWIDIELEKVTTDDGLECNVIRYLFDPILDEEMFPGCRAQVDPDFAKKYI